MDRKKSTNLSYQFLAHSFNSRVLVIIVGFLISAIFLVFAAGRLDWIQVETAFKFAKWLPWIPLSLATYVLGMLLRGMRLKVLVKQETALTTLTGTNIAMIGFAANNILPARLGEFVRAAVLAELTKLSYAESLGITFLERLLDGLTVLVLFIISTILLPSQTWMLKVIGIASFILILALLVVSVAIVSPNYAIAIVSNVSNKLPENWRNHVVAFIRQILRGLRLLRNSTTAALVCSLTLLVWLIEACFFMVVLPCFYLSLDFVKAMQVMSFTSLAILIPSSPGFVGTYHLCCKTTLLSVFASSPITAHNLNEAVALSYAVVVHLLFYATVTLWGLIALIWYWWKLGLANANISEQI